MKTEWETGWKAFVQDHIFRNKKNMDMRSQAVSAIKSSGTKLSTVTLNMQGASIVMNQHSYKIQYREDHTFAMSVSRKVQNEKAQFCVLGRSSNLGSTITPKK